MKFPKLKNALLCLVLAYAVVLGGLIAPFTIVVNIKAIPVLVKNFILILFSLGTLTYLWKNYEVLMGMGIVLTIIDCYNTARKQFALPDSFSIGRCEAKFENFGKGCQPISANPIPSILRYKSSRPVTVYSSGIEKVIAAYHTAFLDKKEYLSILFSAQANSKALLNRKKHHLLDRAQRKSPLNRVTVVVIFAKAVEDTFRKNLWDEVSKEGGDGFDSSVLPCVIDCQKNICTFDSLRIPYIGFQYPVKNRGIRVIKRYVFDGKLPLSDDQRILIPADVVDTNQSLWDFWKMMKETVVLEERHEKKLYEGMNHGEIISEGNYLHVKWESRGLMLGFELDEEQKIAKVDEVSQWYYPKVNQISKDTIKELKARITVYFANLGYTAEFLSFER